MQDKRFRDAAAGAFLGWVQDLQEMLGQRCLA